MLGLVVIDMQKWMFRHPERAAQIPLLAANISALAKTFAERDRPIFDVRTVHKADRTTWSRLMRKYDYSCLIENTEDAEFVDGYRPPECAKRVIKTAGSAFSGTDFEETLRNAGVKEFAVAGVFIDGCIALTAADAAQRGFDVTFVEDAIGHARLERRVAIMGWLAEDYELKIMKTAQVVAAA